MREHQLRTAFERDRSSLVRREPPFVGRDFELSWLEGRLHDSIRGRPGFCLVSGDAGIGKTRLVRELRAIAERAGMRIHAGRCLEGLRLSYRPLASLLEDLGSEPGGEASEFRQLLGPSAASEPATGPGAGDLPRRAVAFQALTKALFASARRGAILVAIEDLHWADAATLDLLCHLAFAAADEGGPVPLLVIATLRPSEESPALARALGRLAREPIVETLELLGLPMEEVESLLHGAGLPDPSHGLVEHLTAITGGNPLFVHEIVHWLLQEGALESRGGISVSTIDPAAIALPEAVVQAIESKVDGLSAGCREVLEVASLFRDQVDAEAVSGVLGVAREAIEPQLEEALSRRILSARASEYRFAHPLVRQAFRSRPPAPRRARLHRQIAEWLEGRAKSGDATDLAELAHHWALANVQGAEERALRCAVRAGDAAFAAFASVEAAANYETALAVDAGSPVLGARERAALHHRAALAYYRAHDAGPCLVHLGKAIERFRDLRDVEGLASALMERARTEYTIAPSAVGAAPRVGELEQALAALGDSRPDLRCEIGIVLSEAHNFARQPSRALETARDALALGRRLSDERLCARAGTALGSAQMLELRLREARETFRAASRDAIASGDRWMQGLPLNRLPMVLASLGRLGETEEVLREAERIARETGDWGDYSIALGARASIALARGDLDAVEILAAETLPMVRRTGYPWGGTFALVSLAAARGLQGRWQAARDAIGILATPGRIFPEPGPEIDFLVGVVRLRLDSLEGRIDREGLGRAEGMLKLLQGIGPDLGTLAGFCACVELAKEAGRPELAAGAAPVLQQVERDGIAITSGGEFLIPRVLGAAARLAGDLERAEELLVGALELAERVQARPELARGRQELAELLLERGRAGDRERGRELLRAALADFAVLGMEPLRRRAGRLAAELELPLAATAAPVTPNGSLSRRELRMLESIARGRSDAEMAEAFLVGIDTLASEIAALLQTLGVDDRVGAAACAFERGILAPRLESARIETSGDAGVRSFLPASGSPGAGPLVLAVTDIEASTALLQRLGDERARAIFQRHDRLVRTCVHAHGGSEIQHTGDGFILAFRDARAALRCAVAIESRIERSNREHAETPIRVRIGLHAGRVAPRDGRLFGLAVHAAVRVCAHGAGGEIHASESAVVLCEDERTAFEAVGPVALKGIAERVALYRIPWKELARDGVDPVRR
jgi:class 3 adenylate cyclase